MNERYPHYDPVNNLPPRNTDISNVKSRLPPNDPIVREALQREAWEMRDPEYGANLESQTREVFSEQSKSEPGLRFDRGKAPIHVLPPEWLRELSHEVSKLGPLCRLDLVPPDILAFLALHYGKGAEKYSDDNWKKGMSWTRCYDSGMRHMLEWREGNDFDAETNTPHAVAAAWNAFALAWYSIHGAGTDDRAA